MISASHLSSKFRALAGYSSDSLASEVRRLASLSYLALKREFEPRDHIQRLPVELLAEIFTIGQAFELEEEAMPTSHLTASAVCQKWRTIVLGTPPLWRWITIDDHEPWTRTLTYLERAEQCPLRIKIHWTEEEGEEVVSHRNVEQLNNVLDFLVPHVDRWQLFSLEVSQYTLIYHALARLEHLSAPCLEELSLSHQDDAEVGPVFEPEALSHSFELFCGAEDTPREDTSGEETSKSLKKARLWGVHVTWKSPLFTRLTSLTLAYHSEDVRPSVENFFSILSSSAPTLEEFTLEYSGPAGDDAIAGWPTESISFPCLRYLKIAFIPAIYIQNLLIIIDAPKLDQLDLDLDEGDDESTMTDWARVIEVICTGGYHPTSTSRNSSRKRGVPLFPVLHTLQLLGYPGEITDLCILLYYHPEVTSLAVNFHWIPPELIEFLSEPISSFSPGINFELPRWVSQSLRESLANSMSTKEEPWLLPKLAVFRAYNQSGTALRNLTEERKKAGIPLREIHYSDGSVMNLRDRMWLSDNLEKLEEFEESDDGSSDDVELEDDDEDDEDEDDA
jgi:F-box-like